MSNVRWLFAAATAAFLIGTGEVRTAAERERVGGLLRGAPGVGSLTNQLQIDTDH